MANLEYIKVTTEKDIADLYYLADMVWHEYFPCILQEEQIDYMVEMFFSEKAISKSISEGYMFFFVKKKGENIGFISVHPEKERLFLSKLYLTKEERGKGYASLMLNFVKELGKEKGLSAVYLTVNKNNTHTIEVYKHHNFAVISSEQFDIGNGYIMDDYVMECAL